MTAAASSFGIGVLVLTMGISDTLSRQVSDQFDALRATEIVVRSAEGSGVNFTAGEEVAMLQLPGVSAAGIVVQIGSRPVSRLSEPVAGPSTAIEVLAASPGAIEALGVQLDSGRAYDEFHQAQAPNIALVGVGAATRLGVDSLDGHSSIFIDGRPYVVGGVFSAVQRRPAYTGAVMIPIPANLQSPDSSNLEELLVTTRPGAAGVVAAQTPYVLRPEAPDTVTVTAPPDPATLRRGIEANLRAALLAIGMGVLVIGVVGISNATFVSVIERAREIGVRRAIGARPAHIWLQVVSEAGTVGAVGGLIGSSLAIISLVVISAMQSWTPTIGALAPMAGPVVGAIVGCVAGLIPARHATRIQPTEALRL